MRILPRINVRSGHTMYEVFEPNAQISWRKLGEFDSLEYADLCCRLCDGLLNYESPPPEASAYSTSAYLISSILTDHPATVSFVKMHAWKPNWFFAVLVYLSGYPMYDEKVNKIRDHVDRAKSVLIKLLWGTQGRKT